ncbi:peptidase M20 [Virgibacillus phasianinus]|uniref:Peptidase M20 n=1 Tax=Virgibacillus phasianinus TaxID=2017483 RepID=A0A220U8C1_9BACI|nr:amidohydrolase [Virgibacillus phasianinus]ASK64389.1 peptidase M20 [Virgibacillus phasianinus]
MRADAMFAQLVQWRRRLHANPELSFQEVETARYVAQILKTIPGMRIEVGVGLPTAVVGTLSSGSGPTIAIRADMDALPILEENDHDFRSHNEGVMHACGHDAHITIGLGTASLLSTCFQNREIQGTVKFLFQPAEEKADENGSTGAPYMIQAGVLAEVDCVIALHMSPEDQLGEVRVHDGYSMANVDVFEATVHGTGSHGAYPHLGTDPIWMLGPVLQALHGIVARRVSPLEAAVISIGSIKSGTASNVIPSEVTLNGTIRSYHPDVRKVLHIEMERAFSIITNLGGEYELTITPEDPSLKNSPEVNLLIKDAINAVYPDFTVIDTPFGLGGEDFAHMTQVVPGAMFFLGCAVNDGKIRDLHTPLFDIDEKVLPVGVSILTEAVTRFLADQILPE